MKFIYLHKHILCLFYIICDICTQLLFSSNDGQSLSHWAGATSLMANVGLAEFLSFVASCKLQHYLLSFEYKHHRAVTSS